MKKYALGVDVGGTTCKIGLFETSGELIEKWEIKTNTKNNGAAILPDVAAYEETIRALGGVDLQLLGLGNNGHIGFNEPAEVFEKETHCVDLAQSTL